MRTDYNVTVEECSKELSHKERVQLMDTTSAIRLDKATTEGAVLINPDFWAVLAIHNEKSQDKDYKNYLIVDKDGSRYVTGSESFWSSFTDIMTEMADSDEQFSIRAYRADSKNRPGKQFITCEII